MDDEQCFRGGLFATESFFKKRMQFLENHKYPIVSLNDAVEGLESGSFPDLSTVITIDDGWYGTASVMAPILKSHDFPATLYVSSYYMNTQTLVFNVAVDYVLWKSTVTTIDLSDVKPELVGSFRIDVEKDRLNATDALWAFANTLANSEERQTLLQDVCKVVDFDFDILVKKRMFMYMTSDDVKKLRADGIDAQLHTHRHRFIGEGRESVSKEINENQNYLQNLNTGKLNHFCYPSGDYNRSQAEWLSELGILSATTTEAGMNDERSNPLELKRYMDYQNKDLLEFEAEMSGFYELINIFSGRMQK